MLTLKERYC